MTFYDFTREEAMEIFENVLGRGPVIDFGQFFCTLRKSSLRRDEPLPAMLITHPHSDRLPVVDLSSKNWSASVNRPITHNKASR